MNRKEITEKLGRFGIIVAEKDDIDFVQKYGYYRYRKIKAKMVPSDTACLADVDELYRFDVLLNRTLYKYMRPIERSLKKRFWNSQTIIPIVH